MSKIPVLLADDDRIILDNIVHRINWADLGFEIVGTASNGASALTLFQQVKPELVITDVVMPVMNGLELIREIRRLKPDVQILLISSYEEFAYVREAIALGARGYVLKSELFEPSFISELRSVQADISSDLNLRAEALRSALEQFLTGGAGDQALGLRGGEPGAMPDQLTRCCGERYRFAIFFEALPFDLRDAPARDAAPRQAEHARLLNRIDGAAESGHPAKLSFFANDMLVIGLEAGGGGWLDYAELLNSGFRARFSWVYTEGSVSLSELRELLCTRWNSLRYLRHFLPVGALPLNRVPKDQTLSERFAYIRLIDENMDLNSLSLAIDRYLRDAAKLWDGATVETFLRRFTIQMETLSMFQATIEERRCFDDVRQMIHWVVETCQSCHEIATRGRAESYSQPVRLAIHCMEENYANPELRAEDIAHAAALSLSRLQVIFKREAGRTINDYLTDLRISHAIQLLETSQMKVYEIAEAVGYSSSQYFSQVLYQRTNKRPLDYRRAAANG